MTTPIAGDIRMHGSTPKFVLSVSGRSAVCRELGTSTVTSVHFTDLSEPVTLITKRGPSNDPTDKWYQATCGRVTTEFFRSPAQCYERLAELLGAKVPA